MGPMKMLAFKGALIEILLLHGAGGGGDLKKISGISSAKMKRKR